MPENAFKTARIYIQPFWTIYKKQKHNTIQKFKETGDSRNIYQNDLDIAFFRHDVAFKDFARRTASDKILLDNAFNIGKNPKYGKYQRDLPFLKKTFLIKRLQVEQLKNENISFKELA